MHAMTVPPLGYSYEMAVGMDGMCLMAVYDGGDRWAHEQCDTKHTMCSWGGVDRSHMKRSPEEIRSMGSVTEGKAKHETETEGINSQEEDRKYYNRRGEVVGTGPSIPMRLRGLVTSAHQISKPSAKYPCD